MKIVASKTKDAELLATLVRESNKDVADLFDLNIHNAPKHPSFCTSEWILSEFVRGQEYFIITDAGIAMGCVGFEQPDQGTAYLNRLSVLPDYRCRGIGSKLVSHILDYSEAKGIKSVSIGIVAEHIKLKDWYLKLGFNAGSIQKFEHLPFDVLYMHYDL